jgi:hypothetical protein
MPPDVRSAAGRLSEEDKAQVKAYLDSWYKNVNAWMMESIYDLPTK